MIDPGLVFIYVLVALLLIMVGLHGAFSEFSDDDDRRDGARLFWAALVWPLAAVGLLLFGLWRLASIAIGRG